MKRLTGYLKEFRLECALGPLLKLMEACLELMVPLVMAAIIDRGVVGGAGTGYILRMGLLLAGMGLGGLAFSVTAQFFAAKAACGFASKLRHALFEKSQRISRAQLDAIGGDTLISRMTADVNQVQSGLNLALRLLLRSPFVVFGAMIMAFAIDARCATLFALLIPALGIVVAVVMRATMPMHKRSRKLLDGLLGATRENLSGARVIRAFNLEDKEIAGFQKRNGALTALNRRSGRISAAMNPATFVLVNAALILLIQTGAVRVDQGGISQGQLVALVNYMSQILVELVKLADLIVSVSRALVCAGRVADVLSVEAETPAPPENAADDSGCAVRFDHVTMTYPGGGAPALTDVSFSALPGQTVGIIGGTGSGKSTLVKLIDGFYAADAGAVYVAGREVRAWDRRELRKTIGYVPQRAALFAGTLGDNLRFADGNASDEAVFAALEAAQAADVVNGRPEGLEAQVRQGGGNFSGGQRQRLTIARALVGKPDILILDDSASALDFATDARLRGAIRALPFHPTVFVVSQRASALRRADLILVLEDGRLAGKGTHDELMQDCPVYREICLSQEGGDAA